MLTCFLECGHQYARTLTPAAAKNPPLVGHIGFCKLCGEYAKIVEITPPRIMVERVGDAPAWVEIVYDAYTGNWLCLAYMLQDGGGLLSAHGEFESFAQARAAAPRLAGEIAGCAR